MATYKGIQGSTVQSLSADPPGAQSSGQLWYNSTSNVWKITSEGTGAWASGGAVPGTGLQGWPGSAGTVTAALTIGGITSIAESGTYINESYEYDGTSWGTEVSMNRDTGAYTQGLGTQTAAISGGYYRSTTTPAPTGVLNVSESYNGVAWTTTNPTQNALGIRTGCGTLTAGLEAGGTDVTPTVSGVSESFDGTTWADVASLNTSRSGAAQHNGTLTASFCIGGGTPTIVGVVEEFNGTGWTETTAINTPRKGVMGSGTTALALIYAGEVPSNSPIASILTESWNGTSWTEVADLTTGRGGGGSAGTTNTGALCISGATGLSPGYTTSTEVWASPNYAVETVTTS